MALDEFKVDGIGKEQLICATARTVVSKKLRCNIPAIRAYGPDTPTPNQARWVAC